MGKMMRPSARITDSGELADFIRSLGGQTSSGQAVNTTTAMQVGAVFACVLVLSQSIGQIPIHLIEQKGPTSKRRATDHHLYQLAHDDPNGWMTSFEFKQFIMACLLLRGNSLWFKTKAPGSGKILELIPVIPDLVESIIQDERYRLFYKIRRPGENGQVDTIPAERILHFRGLSLDGFTGVSPIKYCKEMVGLALAAEKHGSKLFSNGARFGGILYHPGKLSKDASERLRTSFDEKFAGVENAHKTALFQEGMKWQQVTMTSEDAQFLESRKFQRSEIAGIFRVPAHMINDLEKATFSNIEHMDLAFVKHSLMPWLVNIEQTLKKSLMTSDEKKKYFFKFNPDALLRGDLKSRNESHALAVTNGWMSRNEVRELEDRDPFEGGDQFTWQSNNTGVIGDEPEKTA